MSAARPEDAICSPQPEHDAAGGGSSTAASLPDGTAASVEQQQGKAEQPAAVVGLLDMPPQDWFGKVSEALMLEQPTRLGKVRHAQPVFTVGSSRTWCRQVCRRPAF